jgi:DnaJ family protein C protein 28
MVVMARDWKTLVDRLLDEAHLEGKFDNLPGGGKPLNLYEDPNTPSDLRLAHKILKEHDLAPEWMRLGKDVEAMRERLLENMQKGARAYRGALADAERSDRPFDQRQQAERTWARAKEAYSQAAAKLNGEIARYNLKVPPGINQKALFNLERELARLLG